MKKICRNCGAKVPKKSDLCPKCGEPYEYIDVVRVDPEMEKQFKVEKPSIMLNVCLLILSILILCYSVVLAYFKFQENQNKPDEPDYSTPAVTEEQPEETEVQPEDISYNGIDFLGLPLSEIKKTIGDKYTIKIGDDGTLLEFSSVPVTLFTKDSGTLFSDDSVITKVILTDNGQITPVINASMSFDQLKMVLGFAAAAPELNEEDAYYYVHETLDRDGTPITADFRFDDESTDMAPIEVILSDESSVEKVIMGTVSGIDDYLNMREEPNPGSEVLFELENGDEVEILDRIKSEEGKEWAQICYKDKVGYVSSEFIVENDNIKNIDMFKKDEDSKSDDEDEDKSEEDSDSSDDDE